MTIEIEKKFFLTTEQYQKVSLKLVELGAAFSHEDFEINELYGGGILDEKEAVLRIRKIGDKTILTYKERLENSSDIKRQIEHETKVSDRQAVEKIIESLGFEKVLVYEKRRKTWRLSNAEILLDELPFGLFMEIESSETEIILIEKLLEAGDFQTEHETYPYLTKKHGVRNGQIIEARFA